MKKGWLEGKWEDLEGRIRKMERKRKMKNREERKRNIVIRGNITIEIKQEE